MRNERTVGLEQVRRITFSAQIGQKGATIGVDAVPDVAKEIILGLTCDTDRIDLLETVGLVILAAITGVKIFLVSVFEVHGYITTAVGEILTGKRTDKVIARIAVLADAALPTQLEAGKMVLEDKIDDACESI